MLSRKDKANFLKNVIEHVDKYEKYHDDSMVQNYLVNGLHGLLQIMSSLGIIKDPIHSLERRGVRQALNRSKEYFINYLRDRLSDEDITILDEDVLSYEEDEV